LAATILIKNGLGHILDDFSTTSSGHPGLDDNFGSVLFLIGTYLAGILKKAGFVQFVELLTRKKSISGLIIFQCQVFFTAMNHEKWVNKKQFTRVAYIHT
jgi:hypothetical protein